jgi:hypothetical protein
VTSRQRTPTATVAACAAPGAFASDPVGLRGMDAAGPVADLLERTP